MLVLAIKKALFYPPGGDQSPESSAQWTPGGSPESAGHAARHHFRLNRYRLLCFLLHVTALRVPPGFPRRRNGPQRRYLVATGDQSAVCRSHASGGGGGPLEANVSGKDDVA